MAESKAKSVGIISKPEKPELTPIVKELLAWFSKHGYKVVGDPYTAPHAPGIEIIEREAMASRPLNFVVVLGGDGTLLAGARAIAKADIPILGVNLGTLGFLTEVPREELFSTLEGIEQSCCNTETRAMVHCQVMRKGACVGEYHALNDVVVGKGTIARLNHCDLFINREFVSSYQADSIIVSTPTGSTAYSLAAGGPILMPAVDAFVITPVSAHSLTHRPLVIRDSAEIELVAKTGEDEAYLSIDGQVGMPLYNEDRVLCRKSQYQVKLLRIKGTFFDVLHSKLKWGQR